MRKQILLTGLIGACVFSTFSHAADAKKPLPMWLCSDFLEISEAYRPVVVGYAEALNKKGKVEDAVLDVEGIQTITPQLVKQCTENPKIMMRDALAGLKAGGK